MDIKKYINELGKQAYAASRKMAAASSDTKNAALHAIAKEIIKNKDNLIKINDQDLQTAKKSGLEPALLDRLELTAARIDAMADGLEQVAGLEDLIGKSTKYIEQTSGIKIGRMRVPLGVIGIIYESRPNVTADAAGLCLKSGNATILRGGSEAIHSNQAIASCIRTGLKSTGLPENAVQLIETTEREAVGELLRMPDYVDVIVPRGGKGLIERVSAEARMPVIKHLDGICHVYIDDDADIEKAISIAYNAKTQRYGTCNTMECLLIARSLAKTVLEKLGDIKIATDEDYATEYLAPILSLKIVTDIDEAMQHIDKFGSKHTDTIVTENKTNADRFLREVDSSSVMLNASTRFADGYEYGLGAEIGISTDKFHARGPVGLEGLTSQKYIVLGDGHIRS